MMIKIQSRFYILSVLVFLSLISGCTTVPRQKGAVSLSGGDVSLKELCDANHIIWSWDSISQVITMDVNGKKIKALVGSDTVLRGEEKIALSKPIRFERSSIIVPQDFKIKIIDQYRPVQGKEEIQRSFGVKKVREVVIDAGHGGKDPGALSKRGAKEKNVVLDIATRVKSILEQHDIKVKMTRRSDVFLTLQERTEIASHGKTDLFVSIHANSNPSRSVQGLEVYMAPDLSEEDKKEDQRRSNLRLMVQHLEMKKTDSNLQKIVADMLYTQKQIQSAELARQVLYGVCAHADVKNRGVHEARFFVIRNTLIPAILIETGYLTNAKEERLLTSKMYRQKLAQGIARSIINYVEK